MPLKMKIKKEGKSAKIAVKSEFGVDVDSKETAEMKKLKRKMRRKLEDQQKMLCDQCDYIGIKKARGILLLLGQTVCMLCVHATERKRGHYI